MSENERRRKYRYNHVLIETERVLDPEFDDAVVYLTGAQIELLRNVTQYLSRYDTYASTYRLGYYLAPTNEDYDSILAIVADLEEVIMGNPNTIFGYSDRILVDMGETKSGDGDYSAYSDLVPAGKVWLLQHAHFQNPYGTRGALTVQLQGAGEYHLLIKETNPARTLHTWDGMITMKEDDRLRIVQSSCLDGDTLWAGIIANEMDVPA